MRKGRASSRWLQGQKHIMAPVNNHLSKTPLQKSDTSATFYNYAEMLNEPVRCFSY